jgi:putative ABC transport system permease protein
MPDWNDQVRPRLARLRLSPAREGEIVEELSQHLDQRYEELLAKGHSVEDATRLAIDELLEPDALANHMRTLRQAHVPPPIAPGAPKSSLVRDLGQDVRYAMRTVRKQPAFALTAILTLALGIGVNSAIFALVDATLLRPLPYPAGERLVMLSETTSTSRSYVSPVNMADWNDRSRTFEAFGGFAPTVGGMVMAGADGNAETVPRQWVSSGLFDALGVKAIAGRTFLPSDDATRANVVVLSEAFWQTRFNSDPSVVGRDLRLDGTPFTVVGIVPKDFQLLRPSSMWALRSIPRVPQARRAYLWTAVGRMKPGVSLESARADLSTVADGLAREFPETNQGRGVALEPLHDALIGSDLRLTSMLFLGVVGIVLLMCCANVANLLLARATSRARELAVRSALGASRRRVIQQLLTESLLLSCLGAIVGGGIGAMILRAAPSIVPEGLLPAAVTVTFDLRVIAFCAVTALLVGLLFGLAPSWHATGVASSHAMASDNRTMTGRGGKIRGLLVVAEVSTAVVLLFGAGLLLRTLLAVETVDRGYRADRVLTMMVDPLGSSYPTPEALLRFFDSIEHELRSIPSVFNVAWASTLPLGESDPVLFEIIGDPPLPEHERPTADYQIISPTYFQTIDLPIVDGRPFGDRDAQKTTPVCIVSESFVHHHLQGRSPIGMHVGVRPSGSPQTPPVVREIVGVARTVKGRPDELQDRIQLYVPLAQRRLDDMYVLIRPTVGDAESLAPSVRAAIGRIDTEQLVSVRDVMTLNDVAGVATARHRFRAVLVTMFAGLATVLAMVGLFGILAYAVQQRTRDIGVRRVLGATTGDVLRLVAGSASRMIVAGAVIGLVLSTIWGRLLATMLFGVQPLDPMTFASVLIVVVLTAALSAAAPAWRATRIDPAAALRSD